MTTPCSVVTFDCTVEGRSISPRHRFFKTCISSSADSHRQVGNALRHIAMGSLWLRDLPLADPPSQVQSTMTLRCC